MLVALGAAAALLACERQRDLASRRRLETPSEVGASPAAAVRDRPRDAGTARLPPESTTADAGVAHRGVFSLDVSTRRSMKVSAFGAPPSRLAFGKSRLALLTGDALVVREVPGFGESVRVPVEHPTALAVLADGGFLASTQTHAVKLEPSEKKPRVAGRIVFPVQPLLFGDRRFPNRVWATAPRGSTLFGYDLDQITPLGAPDEWVDLDDYDRRVLISMRDGSFVYSVKSGFSEFWGTNRKHSIDAPGSGDILKALPGSRPDTLWMLTANHGDLSRVLAGKLVVLQHVTFESTPFLADAAGDYLVVLELNQPADAPWTFLVEAFDTSGKRTLRESLPAVEALGADWFARLADDRELAASSNPALVAVGGPNELTVWDPKSGARVFPEP